MAINQNKPNINGDKSKETGTNQETNQKEMARNQNKPKINGDKSKQANNKWFEIKRIKKT